MLRLTICWEDFMGGSSRSRKLSRNSRGFSSWLRIRPIVNFRSQIDKNAFLWCQLRRAFSVRVSCPASRGLRFPCLVFLLIAIAGRSSAQELDPWTVDHFTRAVRAQHSNDLSTAESEYRLITSRNPQF